MMFQCKLLSASYYKNKVPKIYLSVKLIEDYIQDNKIELKKGTDVKLILEAYPGFDYSFFDYKSLTVTLLNNIFENTEFQGKKFRRYKAVFIAKNENAHCFNH